MPRGHLLGLQLSWQPAGARAGVAAHELAEAGAEQFRSRLHLIGVRVRAGVRVRVRVGVRVRVRVKVEW